jgi:hypothetical protein
MRARATMSVIVVAAKVFSALLSTIASRMR